MDRARVLILFRANGRKQCLKNELALNIGTLGSSAIRSPVPIDDGLWVSKFIERRKTLFTSMPALTHSAERQFDASACAVAVDIDLAGSYLPGHALLASAVSCPDARQQTVFGRVGQFHRLGLITKRHC